MTRMFDSKDKDGILTFPELDPMISFKISFFLIEDLCLLAIYAYGFFFFFFFSNMYRHGFYYFQLYISPELR